MMDYLMSAGIRVDWLDSKISTRNGSSRSFFNVLTFRVQVKVAETYFNQLKNLLMKDEERLAKKTWILPPQPTMPLFVGLRSTCKFFVFLKCNRVSSPSFVIKLKLMKRELSQILFLHLFCFMTCYSTLFLNTMDHKLRNERALRKWLGIEP